ncbi:hypothetical protein V6N11_011505 [Hibiscus sabdariffa]|uniref:DNA-3-methyladenine glycosylase I n=1 Tax=Hibiscus sabdariffa TaxID=183260 RepID=A0ABR2S8Z8_9ROSI
MLQGEGKIINRKCLISPHCRRREFPIVVKSVHRQQQQQCQDPGNGEVRRCHWITKNSDMVYISFHDEQWGVPVYDDKKAFLAFDPENVAKMGDKEINEISSNKAIMLAESKQFHVGYVSYKATINRYKYPRNVPLRTPKAEAISKDLLKHGFRLVGPVIMYSFMQAAGLTIDHLVDCFRYNECLTLAERPWRHI